MSRWDCHIEIIRSTVVEAEDEGQARAEALNWFFNECVHAIDERDVMVQPMGDER